MDRIPSAIDNLERSARAIEGLVRGLPTRRARWRPDQSSWSILEVVHHLLDEEREDFRQRLDLLLEQPGVEWPGIDPEGWVAQRRYNEKELDAVLDAFLEERGQSLQWLGDLRNPRWEESISHPQLGPLRAGDLLAAWVAHDLLHLRQLTRLVFLDGSRRAEPFGTDYAGSW